MIDVDTPVNNATPKPSLELSLFQQIESLAGKLSVRNRFWNGLLAFFCMPSVFLSGIRMRFTPDAFEAVLPFRRFNRNSYGTMSGAALLGNCEVAAGGYIFYASVGQFRVVCKRLNYTFRYPCTGAVKYVIEKNNQLKHLLDELKPFTIDLTADIYQLNKRGEIIRKVGSALTTFHARPIGYKTAKHRREQ